MEKVVRSKTIGARVTPDEYRAFLAFAKAKGFDKWSDMLRLMLSRVCPGDIEAGEPAAKVLKSATMFLSWSPAEDASIRQRGKQEGTSRQGWIRKVVRAALHKTPQFNRDEETALLESNRELAHLGRNINQIAHQLNISLNSTDLINAERLEALARAIEMHREKVYDLINANWGRFGGEDE